jgi:hypothetical protein
MPDSVQLEPIINFTISAFVVTGVAVMASRAIGHHSIPWEAKKPLVKKYGTWAVNRAESFCPENDVACVEREAKRLIEVYRYRREL